MHFHMDLGAFNEANEFLPSVNSLILKIVIIILRDY